VPLWHHKDPSGSSVRTDPLSWTGQFDQSLHTMPIFKKPCWTLANLARCRHHRYSHRRQLTHHHAESRHGPRPADALPVRVATEKCGVHTLRNGFRHRLPLRSLPTCPTHMDGISAFSQSGPRRTVDSQTQEPISWTFRLPKPVLLFGPLSRTSRIVDAITHLNQRSSRRLCVIC